MRVDEEIDDIHRSLCVFFARLRGVSSCGLLFIIAQECAVTNQSQTSPTGSTQSVRRSDDDGVANLHKSSICAYGRVRGEVVFGPVVR